MVRSNVLVQSKGLTGRSAFVSCLGPAQRSCGSSLVEHAAVAVAELSIVDRDAPHPLLGGPGVLVGHVPHGEVGEGLPDRRVRGRSPGKYWALAKAFILPCPDERV